MAPTNTRPKSSLPSMTGKEFRPELEAITV